MRTYLVMPKRKPRLEGSGLLCCFAFPFFRLFAVIRLTSKAEWPSSLSLSYSLSLSLSLSLSHTHTLSLSLSLSLSLTHTLSLSWFKKHPRMARIFLLNGCCLEVKKMREKTFSGFPHPPPSLSHRSGKYIFFFLGLNSDFQKAFFPSIHWVNIICFCF